MLGMLADVRLDISGILMPTELHARFAALHNILIIMKIGVIADGGAANGGHEVTKDEAAQSGLRAIGLPTKIPLPAVIDSENVSALSVHLFIYGVDCRLAFRAQQL